MQQKSALMLLQNGASEVALAREAIIYLANSILKGCAHLSGYLHEHNLE